MFTLFIAVQLRDCKNFYQPFWEYDQIPESPVSDILFFKS